MTKRTQSFEDDFVANLNVNSRLLMKRFLIALCVGFLGMTMARSCGYHTFYKTVAFQKCPFSIDDSSRSLSLSVATTPECCVVFKNTTIGCVELIEDTVTIIDHSHPFMFFVIVLYAIVTSGMLLSPMFMPMIDPSGAGDDPRNIGVSLSLVSVLFISTCIITFVTERIMLIA